MPIDGVTQYVDLTVQFCEGSRCLSRCLKECVAQASRAKTKCISLLRKCDDDLSFIDRVSRSADQARGFPPLEKGCERARFEGELLSHAANGLGIRSGCRRTPHSATDQEPPVQASRASGRFLRNRTFALHSCELASRPRLIKHSCCSSQSYRTCGVILTVREPMASRGGCTEDSISVLNRDERD